MKDKEIIEKIVKIIENGNSTYDSFREQVFEMRKILVYMKENLNKHNNDFIQFLEDMPIPNAPNNSPNKVEFYNGATITKNIILKKLKSLSRE